MKNRELARIFSELADVLEYKGENPFKVGAYRRASRALADLSEDVAVLAREDRLREVPGIGEAIAKKIKEYLETGHMKRYEEALQGTPKGLLEMLAIPGLGPKTVAVINQHLGIETVAELEEAARAGKLEGLPGLGARKVENILHGITLRKQASQRVRLGDAIPAVEAIVAQLRAMGIERVVPAGSLRRMRETVGDLDILAAGEDSVRITKAFTSLPMVAEVLAAGETRASVRTHEGLQVDLRVVPPASFGAACQYFTGSKAHNIRLRDLAKRHNLKVNEYGVFRGEKMIAGADEESVYRALGLPLIPPTLREDRGEIEAALAGQLPRVVELEDIRGDLHVHTDWSDGRDSIEQMAAAAKAIGYQYLAISDHTRALKVFGGLDETGMEKLLRAVREADARVKGIRLLAGVEVDIHADGSLDLPDRILAKLDIVTASVHSAFKQPAEKMTARLLAAIRNPHVDVIGHLTGRLLGEREAYDFDLEAVLQEAARHHTALELNAHPLRLDITDVVCRRARDLGIMVAINTDAHNTEQLQLMRFGVATAQRGWLEAAHVLNTRPFRTLMAWLRGRRCR